MNKTKQVRKPAIHAPRPLIIGASLSELHTSGTHSAACLYRRLGGGGGGGGTCVFKMVSIFRQRPHPHPMALGFKSVSLASYMDNVLGVEYATSPLPHTQQVSHVTDVESTIMSL